MLPWKVVVLLGIVGLGDFSWHPNDSVNAIRSPVGGNGNFGGEIIKQVNNAASWVTSSANSLFFHGDERVKLVRTFAEFCKKGESWAIRGHINQAFHAYPVKINTYLFLECSQNYITDGPIFGNTLDSLPYHNLENLASFLEFIRDIILGRPDRAAISLNTKGDTYIYSLRTFYPFFSESLTKIQNDCAFYSRYKNAILRTATGFITVPLLFS